MKVCTSLAENGKKKPAQNSPPLLPGASSLRLLPFFASGACPAFRILGLRLRVWILATPNYPYDSDAHKLLGSFGSKPDKLPDLPIPFN